MKQRMVKLRLIAVFQVCAVAALNLPKPSFPTNSDLPPSLSNQIINLKYDFAPSLSNQIMTLSMTSLPVYQIRLSI